MFILGVFFKIGVLKYIADLMADDQAQELKCSKQPWE